VKPLLGLHHVTALAGDAQQNLNYYRNTVGLRLVKRTVNYDDPASHHFYYADPSAAIGTVLTFFPWGTVRTARTGAGQAVAVAYSAAPNSVQPTEDRFGHPVEVTQDPDGMTLECVAIDGAHGSRLHSATVWAADLAAAEALCGGTLQLERVGEERGRVRYAIGSDQYLDLLQSPVPELGKLAAGSIHHVALRVHDEATLLAWRERLIAAGLRVTPVKDRFYFHSIYFRPAGNTLFEIATDGPGFTVDEPAEMLGGRLCLPPWLQEHRAEIEERLTPVTI
jgi:glyoxalase family protein